MKIKDWIYYDKQLYVTNTTSTNMECESEPLRRLPAFAIEIIWHEANVRNRELVVFYEIAYSDCEGDFLRLMVSVVFNSSTMPLASWGRAINSVIVHSVQFTEPIAQ